jgi:hypothetical protein
VTNNQAYKDREFIKAVISFKVQTAALGLSNLEGKEHLLFRRGSKLERLTCNCHQMFSSTGPRSRVYQICGENHIFQLLG